MKRREIFLYSNYKKISKLAVSIDELDFIMECSENMSAIYAASEVVNLNNYTITTQQTVVNRYLLNQKPFVFLINLN